MPSSNKSELRLANAIRSEMVLPDKPECLIDHLGLWAMEPKRFGRALAMIKSGTWHEVNAQIEREERKSFILTQDGIAVIPVDGIMMKGFSKFGGVSTIFIRRQLREALQDEDVQSIMLLIDSPGGSVAGTQDLADDIKAINEEIPIHAHIDDLGASAAFWIASQARSITANKTALIGSIGIFNVLVDSSEQAKREGLEVHLISTGKFKASGIDGVKVTDEVLAEFQTIVDDHFVHFKGSVMTGRNFSEEQFEVVSDGRVHMADKALKMGLIDGIGSFGDIMLKLSHDINASDHEDPRRRRRQSIEGNRDRAEVLIKLAEN